MKAMYIVVLIGWSVVAVFWSFLSAFYAYQIVKDLVLRWRERWL